MKFLVTGAAGFIGFWTSKSLMDQGHQVVGLDNLNDYYDVRLKQARLEILRESSLFEFAHLDLADNPAIQALFQEHSFDRVIHLAAQAGVRYSIQNPHVYVHSNVLGTLNILEGCRHTKVEALVYASTSSVYGNHENMPFRESDAAVHPISFYAATKMSCEMMAHSYSSLYDLPTTGLRFFTVYGPWGRPDMALFMFTKNILEGRPIEVFNHGHHARDFTFVDDIVEGVIRVAMQGRFKPDASYNPKHPDPAESKVPYRIYNIGNGKPEPLLRYIEVIEKVLGKKAQKNMLPLQLGDVPSTHASVDRLAKDFDYQPSTSIDEGIEKFVKWYREYYRV